MAKAKYHVWLTLLFCLLVLSSPVSSTNSLEEGVTGSVSALSSSSELSGVSNLVKAAEINRRVPGSGQSIGGIMDKAGAGRSLDLLYSAQRSDLLAGELAVVRSGRTIPEVAGGLSPAKTEEVLEYLGKLERRYGSSAIEGKNTLIWAVEDEGGVSTIKNTKIKGTTLVVEGDNYYGYTHYWKKHVTGTIPNGDLFKDMFPEIAGNEEAFLREWVPKTIKNGDVVALSSSRFGYVIEPFEDGRKMLVVVEYNFDVKIGIDFTQSSGSTQSRLITTYPCITKPNCF
ncbi:MAG: hypothetical protein JW778_04530 [Candidatus Altiarchaeota archaeon]|nr:hypothetical protein [Candidatus Altiarchaeota archaeon]